MEETLEQIGEGRGMNIIFNNDLGTYTDYCRNLWTRLPGEKSRETPAKLWHRGAHDCFFLDPSRL
jgi:hypothetical protein